MRISAGLPAGVSALLFESARRRRDLEHRLVSQLEGRAFEEVVLPVLDYVEPYERLGSSPEELYRFVDRDGELLALRADPTPMLARVVAPILETPDLPLRLFYLGDVVRYRRSLAGQMREQYQLGVEILDDPGDSYFETERDQELLELFIALLEEADFGAQSKRPMRIIVSCAGALDALLESVEPDETKRRQLESAFAGRQRESLRHHQELLAVLDRGLPKDPARLGDLRTRVGLLCALVSNLKDRTDISFDLAEFARPLEPARSVSQQVERARYYDGLLIRAYAPGEARPIGQGGRYDGLFQSLGAPVAAAGFSLSLDRLLFPGGAA